MKEIYPVIDSAEALEKALERVRAAQKKFAEYSQSQVDSIFKAAAAAADRQRIPFARLAVEETGMGVVEDKVIKNTTPRNIFTTPTGTPRPAALLRRISNTA